MTTYIRDYQVEEEAVLENELKRIEELQRDGKLRMRIPKRRRTFSDSLEKFVDKKGIVNRIH